MQFGLAFFYNQVNVYIKEGLNGGGFNIKKLPSPSVTAGLLNS
ncbi:hypothetical protein B4144_0861 [Bacillus atrophaeus]|nr:hypothetical protein B4144_0861 [Bacillus atrophaeus]